MHHPLNLRVLQRHDPTITDIVDSTSYAVLYDFQDDRWHKTGKEGTLFIYERSEPPTHGIFLLNRSSPENFSHPILASTAFDMQGKVLMLEDAGSDDDSIAVSGLWVSNGEEGQTLLNRLTEIRDSLKSSSAPPPSSEAGPPSALSSLLSGLAASSLAAPQPSPSLATSPSVSSTLASVPAPSSSASTSATTSSVAPATTTTTTTTNGSLSFSEILNRLQSPALPKATPAPSGQQQQHHPSPSDAPSALGHPAHLLQNQHPHPPFPSSPLRQPPLPSHGHGSPAHYPPPPSSSSHPGPGPSSHPPSGPASHFYPYPPHQLHHQQQGPHQPPIHTFAHQHGGSPTASPFQAHAAPAPPMLPYGFPPPLANQSFPPSPFAQHAPVPGLPNGLLHHSGAGPPPPPPSFPGLPHPMQQQQQQQQFARQPHHPPSPMHSPARAPASGARPPAHAAHASLSSAPGPLPRGTQLLDAMFSSMGPPVPASNGH